jgi:hypothetical protein
MRLFIKSIIVFSIPFLILIAGYVYGDPFKIIHDYDLYLPEYVMLRRGFVSTQVFLKNNTHYNFDSFIFGSSRATAFTCKEWRKYLSVDCSVYSYGNWNETIEGIYKKVQFIDSIGNNIKNAIIVIDTDQTFKKDNNSIEGDHYLISGKSLWQFHCMYFIRSLRSVWLIPASIDYKLFRTRRSYMKNFVGMKIGDIDPINNDWEPDNEEKILRDSTAYYSGTLNKFYIRPEIENESGTQISSADSIMIQKINSIFKRHKTDVKIIIGPLYDQIKFNKNDLKFLQVIFGKENIFDFSGINYFTDNIYSFRNDVIHFRNRTGNKILENIYK